jgi:hypothetical protein
MRVSTAYFAGAGTIVVAIAAGLGGGLVIADAVSPQGTRPLSKVELHARAQQQPQPTVGQSSSQTPPKTAIASDAPQAPVPYLSQVQPAVTKPVTVGAAPQDPSQDETANNVLAAASTASTSDPSAGGADVAATKPQPAPQQKQVDQIQQQASTQDDVAAAGDAHSRPQVVEQRHQDEKRRAERHHQQLTARLRQRRDQELLDVEAKVREITEPREVNMRRDDADEDRGGPIGFQRPRLNFFGPD